MRKVMYKSLCYKVKYCPGSWKMPERILFVQLLFCYYNTLLICNKNYYFSIEFLLCSVHWTGSAQWDACSIFLFIIIWKPIVQCFIYSRLHRLCSGTEYCISSLLLLSQSSLHYGVRNFFLISISYDSYYSHSLALLHTKSWFLLGQKETRGQRLGANSFLEETGGTQLQWSHEQRERQAWVS